MRAAALLVRQVRRRHHPVQRHLKRAGRIGQEVGDTAQRLVLARIEHVQDGPHQQRVRSLLPMVAPLQRALRVHQDVGDVLHVAHLVHAAPHFQQRVVGGRPGICRVEQQAVRETRAPAGRQLPVLTLDVVDDGRAGPGQQRGHHQADTLARTCGRKREYVLRPVMAQVLLTMLAKEHSAGAVQPGTPNVIGRGPSCGTVGGDQPRLPRAPDRHAHRNAHRSQAAATRDRTAHVEDIGCVGIEEEPPFEQAPGVVDR